MNAPRGTPPKDNKANIVADRNVASTRISDTCRYVAFGTLAAIFSLMIANRDTEAYALFNAHRQAFIICAELSALSLIFDYLHFLCAKAAGDAALKTNFLYNKRSASYKLWKFFYHSKQVLAGISTLIFILVIGAYGLASP